MFDLDALMRALEDIAPLELSKKQIEKGAYDNSGLLVRHHEKVNKILFSLDLSIDAVEKAKRIGADTIITHHPAIYAPIKELDYTDVATSAVLKAVSYGMNVISMHLNLDVADDGIDQCLCLGLGGQNCKILDYVDDLHGYGREFTLNKTLAELKKKIKEVFDTDKIVVYGNKNLCYNKGASFCGGGASHALCAVKNGITKAEVIITSDAPHHVIKEIVELGVALVLIPHYASENYGFYKFYQRVSSLVGEGVPTYYFDDKRFR